MTEFVPNVLAARLRVWALWSSSRRRNTRSCWSAASGWRCCEPRRSSVWTCRAAPSRPTRLWSTRLTWRRIHARWSGYPPRRARPGSRSSSALAGHEHILKGMTSLEPTENVEQLQVRASLELIRDRIVAAIARLGLRAAEYAERVTVRRSYNVAAGSHARQALASAGRSCSRRRRKVRGASRPVARAASRTDGHHKTSSTCSTATSTSSRSSTSPSRAIPGSTVSSTRSGRRTMCARLQCRRRSVQAAAGPSSLAITIRVMAGHELVT